MVTLLCGVDDHIEITVMSSAGYVKTVFSCIQLIREVLIGVCWVGSLTTDRTKLLVKSVCETALKSLFWDPTCVPGFEYAYTCQLFYIYRRDIFYLKSAKIFRRGPIISEDVRRRSEDFRRRYEEFRLTRTQEHKGTLTSLLKKENSEKVDHPHRLFFSLFGSGFFK